MASHSKKFNLVRTYYKGGFWSKRQVENAVKKGWITSDEYEEITGEAYPKQEEEVAVEAVQAPAAEEPETEDVSEESTPDSEE